MTLRRAVFLDRDGVINENRVEHVRTWSDVRFLPGVFVALQRLSTSSTVWLPNSGRCGRE